MNKLMNVFLGALLVVGFLLSDPAPAVARCLPSLAVSPSPSVVGQTITFTGTCFRPNRDLYWDMYNGIGYYSHSRSNADGTVEFIWPFYIGPQPGPITSTGAGTYLIRVSYRLGNFTSVAQVLHIVLP